MACPCAQPTCNECNPCTPPNPCNPCGPLTAPPIGCESDCELPIYTSTECGNAPGDECISYTGDDNACLGIIKPLSIKAVIAKIITYIKNMFSNVHSSSLVVTPSLGNCNSSLNIEMVPSDNPNNALVLGSDGKPFSPVVHVANGQCITFARTIVSGKIIYTPTLDMNCLSALLCPLCGTPEPTTCVAPGDLTINQIK